MTNALWLVSNVNEHPSKYWRNFLLPKCNGESLTLNLGVTSFCISEFARDTCHRMVQSIVIWLENIELNSCKAWSLCTGLTNILSQGKRSFCSHDQPSSGGPFPSATTWGKWTLCPANSAVISHWPTTLIVFLVLSTEFIIRFSEFTVLKIVIVIINIENHNFGNSVNLEKKRHSIYSHLCFNGAEPMTLKTSVSSDT